MPTVRQRRLGTELKEARKAAGFTLEQAGDALGIAHTTLGRYENAENRPALARVIEMLGLYGGSEALQLAILDLARRARERGWWATYGGVLDPSFAEVEDDAVRISSWQAQLIHGLLQTPDYTRALIRMDTGDEDEIENRLEARQHRKAILARTDAPVLDVVMDEAVLRRPVGGPEVMRGQLRALLQAGERPNVSVRVLPLAAGAYPFIGHGSCSIFGFARKTDPDVAYMETYSGGLFVEDVAEVRRCSKKMQEASDVALSEDDSAALIRAIVKG